jgi:hypothetical protein
VSRLLVALALVAPLAARAQEKVVFVTLPADAVTAPGLRIDPEAGFLQEPDVRTAVLATGSSLVLPGMGQLLLGQRRWTVYAGVELAGWLVHLDRLRQGQRFRRTYRDLAWIAARGMAEPREEGDWEYYEAVGSWHRSGAFDADGGQPGVQPEMDPESYNGAIWELARDLYLPEGAGPTHPAWGRALDYYNRRAIQPALLWDWTGREEHLVKYRDLIDKSDEALRTATVVFGAVVANHLFSAVDAFVSSRLGRASPVSATVQWHELAAGTALEWSVEVRP